MLDLMVSCKDYAAREKFILKNLIDMKKLDPWLVVIQIGDDSASNSYIKAKQRDCAEVGIQCDVVKLPVDVSHSELRGHIMVYNRLSKVDGIILQLPVPPHIDVDDIRYLIDPRKDVDGFGPDSMYDPCTPKGIIEYLEENRFEFEGVNACVVGRSNIVGKPLARMLSEKDCTVTLCNSHSNLENVLPWQDIVFTCTNQIEHLDSKLFCPPQAVIDIGLGRNAEGKLCGNLTQGAIKRLQGTDCTVISGTGGVGLLTRIGLLWNVYNAAKRRM